MTDGTYNKIANQITVDLSTMLFKLIQDYPGYENEMCRLMTGQLGSLIAIAAKDPKQALVHYAQILAAFDWEGVRQDYFANTLGVDTTKPTLRRIDGGRAIQTGNPTLKKPD